MHLGALHVAHHWLAYNPWPGNSVFARILGPLNLLPYAFQVAPSVEQERVCHFWALLHVQAH